MKLRRSVIAFVALLATVGLVAAGCADAGDPVAGDGLAGVQDERIVGTDELRFEPAELNVEPGAYRITFVNEGSLVHQLALGEAGDHGDHDLGDTGEVGPGESASFTVTLEEGTYEYACHVDGHDLGGMVGTLTVE